MKTHTRPRNVYNLNVAILTRTISRTSLKCQCARGQIWSCFLDLKVSIDGQIKHCIKYEIHISHCWACITEFM